MKKLSTKQCENCDGTGQVPDEGTGAILRAEREKRGILAKDMCEALGISDSYLYDLEKGNRAMSNELVDRYQTALEELGVNV